MKVGQRGQVTIPKKIRERFGLKPETDVEFRVTRNSIMLRKKPKKLALEKWRGYCHSSLAKLGYTSVDQFIRDVRGE